MVNGTKEWVAKAGLAGFGLAVGSTLATFLIMKMETPAIAALRSKVVGGCPSSTGISTSYVANGGF